MVSHKRRRSTAVFEAAVSTKKIAHDWEKDGEELELEAKLFGKSKVKRVRDDLSFEDTRGSPIDLGLENEESDSDEGMGHLDDDELFTIDAPVASANGVHIRDDEDDLSEDGSELPEESDIDSDPEPEDEPESEGEEGQEDESASVASSSSSRSSVPSMTFNDDGPRPLDGEDAPLPDAHDPKPPKITFPDGIRQSPEPPEASSSRSSDLGSEDEDPQARMNGHRQSKKGKERAALWTDPADDLIMVDLDENRRLRKLGRGKSKGNGGMISGKVLEQRLREQFERLHPRPEWASLRVKSGTQSLSSLLSSTKSFIASNDSHPDSVLSSLGKKKRGPLKSGTVDLQRLLDANHHNPTTGKKQASNAGNGVVDVVWHPSQKVSVMAVAGGDRRVRFFNVDGHTNPALLTIHLPSLPLTKATFHPSGSSLLLTGTRPFYYTYDLISSKCVRSPRNLFGSIMTPTTPQSLTRHAFSPDGSLLAVAGRRGAVSILDWSGTGVGAVAGELRSGRGGSVQDLVWSGDGKELSVLGGRDGAEVEIWDVGMRRIKGKWRDDRSFGGSIMRLSDDQSYTAVGSSTGIVNLYSSSSLRTTNAEHPLLPEPIKSLEHITSPIASMAFHPSSEMLATASSTRRNRLKLYHLPSGTAFSNWPTPTTPLGRVSVVSFSPRGEYLSVGNQRGKVLLYNVKHFATT